MTTTLMMLISALIMIFKFVISIDKEQYFNTFLYGFVLMTICCIGRIYL